MVTVCAVGIFVAANQQPSSTSLLHARAAGWRDSVHLEHDVAASSAAATWQGPPADLEEKERIR